MKQTKELIVGTYARYSSDNQRETSVDDQQRLCQEVAKKHGYTITETCVYTDKALSGTAKDNTKRLEYQKLMKSLHNKEIDVLIVDEISRMSRDAVELANLQQLIENTGLILLSVDGFTSEAEGWQLNFGLKGIVSQQSSRDTGRRIKRGLEGSLDRGYMTTRPPYGYTYKKDIDQHGNSRGTHWFIDKEQAEVVRGIFKDKEYGKTPTQIAAGLNKRKVDTKNHIKKPDGYWNTGTISRMLKNPIYRGSYEHHGSTAFRYKKNDSRKEISVVEYERENLRIVSNQLWEKVNPCFNNNLKKVKRNIRGCKYKFSGLIKCSVCERYMAVRLNRSINCSNCSEAKRLGVEQDS